jgi:hypothetical protein
VAELITDLAQPPDVLESNHRATKKPSDIPTLLSQGIDKNLANKARIILSETQRTNWRLIWEEEMKDRYSRVSIQQPETRPEPENDAAPPTTEISSDTDVRQDNQPASDNTGARLGCVGE